MNIKKTMKTKQKKLASIQAQNFAQNILLRIFH